VQPLASVGAPLIIVYYCYRPNKIIVYLYNIDIYDAIQFFTTVLRTM